MKTKPEAPIVSRKSYVLVWLALLALLLLTWGLAEVDLGPFNNVAALGIAVSKMLLVVLFFMHGKYEKPLTWVFITAGLIWLLIMVDLTLSDYLTRGEVRGPQTWRHFERNPPTMDPAGPAAERENPASGSITAQGSAERR